MTRPDGPPGDDEVMAELAAAALGALSPEELAAVLDHAASSPPVAAELAAYRAAAALLAHAAPAAPLDSARSARLRARLLARAAADAEAARSVMPLAAVAGGARAPAAAPPARGWVRATPWIALAASAAFAAAALGLARASRERDALRTALRAAEERSAARAESLSVAVVARDRLLSALTGPSVRVVELTAAGARDPVARMFWDRATNRWTMFAHHLPTPPAGRTYQLWLVTTADAKISAGTFTPTPAGDAMMEAEYALEPGALQAIAVTEEPAGGMPQPTGPIVIAGAPAEDAGRR